MKYGVEGGRKGKGGRERLFNVNYSERETGEREGERERRRLAYICF